MESKILGSPRKGYFFRLQVAEDTPLYKAYRYVSHQRVGFFAPFGLKTGQYTLFILLRNQVWFLREIRECTNVLIVSIPNE